MVRLESKSQKGPATRKMEAEVSLARQKDPAAFTPVRSSEEGAPRRLFFNAEEEAEIIAFRETLDGDQKAVLQKVFMKFRRQYTSLQDERNRLRTELANRK